MRLATVSPIWKMGRLDIILLGVPRGCKGLWFIELSCECFLPIKPESVLPAPRGSWAGGLEPERQVGGQSWLLDSCCRLSWACQLAWPRPHSQPLGFPSSWPSPVTAQPSLCSLGTIPTDPQKPPKSIITLEENEDYHIIIQSMKYGQILSEKSFQTRK